MYTPMSRAPQHGVSKRWPSDMEVSCEYTEQAVIKPTRGGPPIWGLCRWLTSTHDKSLVCYKMLHRASNMHNSLQWPVIKVIKSKRGEMHKKNFRPRHRVYKMIKCAFGEETLNHTNIWFAWIKNGKFSIRDEPHTGYHDWTLKKRLCLTKFVVTHNRMFYVNVLKHLKERVWWKWPEDGSRVLLSTRRILV